MKELNSILAAFAEIQRQNNGEQVFLATVVHVQGSTYRQPGARMLMTTADNMLGTISGGCLENDVFEHTRVSMTDGKPIVVTYDTTADEDIIWGFGLGCNGVVKVLIEKLDANDPCNPLALIYQCFHSQEPGIIATVVAVKGEVNIQMGERLILRPDNSINTSIQESYLTEILLKDVQAARQNQHSSFHKYQLALGNVDVFIELIQPPPHLLIFGAGRDAIPVVKFAQDLGWQVTIMDCRAAEVTPERFAIADEVILTRREILHKQIRVNSYTIAVVMTHNYLDDLEILKLLIPTSISYLGCLGSKQRIAKLLQDLRTESIELTPAQMQKLHAPVGLDIGADTPEAIALSIIAEIQAVLAQRSSGFLKNRMQPIYQPNPVKEISVS
ncbi:XdhC family protein [Calothrix rhizosoleniae]|uniref:XdhC family protein n=1 Tax=Calothrix rhizosoleniae TaxID=888997 RepID=UPI000B49F50A|nr:XdhC/CoxI family protein [Calothrix rhizosoleniae]